MLLAPMGPLPAWRLVSVMKPMRMVVAVTPGMSPVGAACAAAAGPALCAAAAAAAALCAAAAPVAAGAAVAPGGGPRADAPPSFVPVAPLAAAALAGDELPMAPMRLENPTATTTPIISTAPAGKRRSSGLRTALSSAAGLGSRCTSRTARCTTMATATAAESRTAPGSHHSHVDGDSVALLSAVGGRGSGCVPAPPPALTEGVAAGLAAGGGVV